MQTRIDDEKVATLYNELQDSIRSKNQDQARRVRRELVRAGRPLSEILSQATNILALEEPKPLDEPSEHGILQQAIQDTLELTSQSPDRLAGSINLGQDPNIASISPPDPEAIGPSRWTGVLPKHTRSTSLPSAHSSDPPGSTCGTATVSSTEPPPRTEVARCSSPHTVGQWAILPFPLTYLGIAFTIVLALASAGWLLLLPPTVEKTVITSAARGSLIPPEGLPSPGAFMAGPATAAVVTSSTPIAPAFDSSGANLIPVPLARLTDVATVPDPPSGAKSPAAPLTADLGVPAQPVLNLFAEVDGLAPTTDPPRTTANTARSASERASDLDVAALRERGDSLLRIGDIASARLFYERALDAGNGEAALRLGATYDPDFLAQARLGMLHGNVEIAAYWYRRAGELGTKEADTLLQAIDRKNER